MKIVYYASAFALISGFCFSTHAEISPRTKNIGSFLAYTTACTGSALTSAGIIYVVATNRQLRDDLECVKGSKKYLVPSLALVGVLCCLNTAKTTGQAAYKFWKKIYAQPQEKAVITHITT